MTDARLAVVITRPAHQAEGLLASLRDDGVEARPLPLLGIEPLLSAAELQAGLAAQADADGWIFTSVNAVAALGEVAPARSPPQIAAIGPATAARLRQLGMEAWSPDAGSDSESLLADARLGEVSGKALVLVTGEGGRGLLAEALRARGARLTVWEVYRRVPLAHPPSRLQSTLDGAGLIQFSSGEAMSHFQRLVPDPAHRYAPDWLVSSPRLADHARRLGYPREPRLTAGPTDEDVLVAVRHFMDTSISMSDTAPPPPPPPTPPAPAETGAPTASGPTLTAGADEHPRPRTSQGPTSPPADPRRRGSSGKGGWAALLTVLLIAAVVGALAWRWAWPEWQTLQAVLSDQQQALAELSSRQAALDEQAADLALFQRRATQDAARLRERLETYDEALAKLSDEVGGGRERVALITAEQLMLVANDRLMLAGDARGAGEALALADERLARLADPRLHDVRAAIAEERAALAALPVIDTAGVALRLDAALKAVDRLPLQRVAVEPPAAEPPVQPVDPLATIWQKIRHAASQLFVLRRQDSGELQARLPASESGLIRGLLQLKLENARSAWLQRDGLAYATVLASARAWMDRYFEMSAPEGAALDAELEILAQIPVGFEAPELSRSLRLLRAQMEPAPR